MANLHQLKLTDRKVKAAPAGKYTDGHGLTLFVQPSGSRQWVQRLVIQGKRREMGLGGYPLVSLAEARDRALSNRRVARSGGDPRHQQAISKAPTFAEATRQVHAIHAPTWKNDRQRQQWIDEVIRIVHPAIGHLPVDVITTAQLTDVFKPIWASKPVIASRVRQRTERIFDWAVSQGYRPDNPAAAPLKANLPKQAKRDHHRAIHHSALREAIDAVRNSTSREMTKAAFEFLVLTATRKSETLEASWNEIDLESRTWIIPASRMKAGREHRVPLSDRAIEILRQVKGRRSTGYIFHSSGSPIDGNTMNKMLSKAGIQASPHGFRATFKGWAMETGQDHTATEFAQAHLVRDKTEAAYAHTTDLFEIRRKMMQEWSEYLNG